MGDPAEPGVISGKNRPVTQKLKVAVKPPVHTCQQMSPTPVTTHKKNMPTSLRIVD